MKIRISGKANEKADVGCLFRNLVKFLDKGVPVWKSGRGSYEIRIDRAKLKPSKKKKC